MENVAREPPSGHSPSIAGGVVYPPRGGSDDEHLASGRGDVEATVAALGTDAAGGVKQGDAGRGPVTTG